MPQAFVLGDTSWPGLAPLDWLAEQMPGISGKDKRERPDWRAGQERQSNQQRRCCAVLSEMERTGPPGPSHVINTSNLLKEKILWPELPSETNVLAYVSQFREHLRHARAFAMEALRLAQLSLIFLKFFKKY